ncbi:MAG: lactonase family protein [Sphingobacteriaceae bacterium]|nr:MAG: lactonase family protein [Sphingobacteriaceae bacterium]
MRRYLILIVLLLPVLGFTQDKKGPKSYNLLVGGYGGAGKGITVYRFYVETGKLVYLSQSDDIVNPSYMCVDKDSKFVYAVSEKSGGDEVSAFSFEPRSGQLTFVNKQSTKGTAACYVSVDEDKKNLFVANYWSGSLAVLPLAKDGAIQPVSQLIQEKGSSINKERQEGPHVHTAVLSPDEKYLLYTDLGTDKINVYRYKSSQQQPLTPASPPFVSVAAGSGPRHIDFSPDKKYMYAVHELTGIVTAYEYNSGKLKHIQSITMLTGNFKGVVGAADIHVTPDGKFLYASNRGSANEIVAYSINLENGMLTFVSRTPTRGKTPRNFVIDPTGKFLLAANQDSDNIFVFKIHDTGRLILTASVPQITKPACLKFASAQVKD